MFGDKIQKKENLPYGWLTHWKWATMVAKIRPVPVTRGGWCCAQLMHRFFKACAITRFRNQFARGQKTVRSHLNKYISEYFPYHPTFGLLPFWDLNKTQGPCHKRLDFRFAKVVPVTIHKSLQFFINLMQMLSLCIRNSILIIVSIFACHFPPNIKFFHARANCSKNLGANIKAPFTHLKATRNSDKNHHINNVTKTSLSNVLTL